MSDFCRQCSIDIFGEDFGDLANISRPGDTQNKKYPVVICEDCGYIQVDDKGNCVSIDCDKKHGKTN